MKKERVLTIRTTPDELMKWQALAQAANVTLSDLIRQQLNADLVGRQPVRQQRTRTVENYALIAIVSKFGNLTNQIARWCNTYKSRADAVQVIAALIAIERQFSAALDDARAKPCTQSS